MINRAEILKLKMPLKNSYALSYGHVDFFDVAAVLLGINGKFFSGAFTGLPGYFDVSPDEIFDEMKKYLPSIISKDESDVLFEIKNRPDNFLLNPIAIAIESADFKESGPITVPIAKIIERSGDWRNADLGEIPKVFKLKVGMKGKLAQDIEFVQTIANNAPKGSEIRVDANQGYDFKSALEFAKAVGNKIIYLEQPFAKSDWESNKKLMEESGVKIMLDESICSIGDIKKAINHNIPFIKLKLAKFGSISKMMEAMEFAEKNNIKVIIGNGVDIDSSAAIEAVIWQKGKTKMAGEMNGFLKTEIKSEKIFANGDTLCLNPNSPEFLFQDYPKEIIKESVVYGK